jgi:hypothetical protein
MGGVVESSAAGRDLRGTARNVMRKYHLVTAEWEMNAEAHEIGPCEGKLYFLRRNDSADRKTGVELKP